MFKIPIGQIGVSCTTLSSALSYLLGAPRVLCAVARDSGWPPLAVFAADDRHAEPLRALLVTWLLVQVIMLTGTVNLLAPLVAGLFLLAFTLINLVCFVASVSRANFAPRFRLHSKWSALGGFAICFVSMTVALASSAAVAVALCSLLLLLLCWQRRALTSLFLRGERPFAADEVAEPLDETAERHECHRAAQAAWYGCSTVWL